MHVFGRGCNSASHTTGHVHGLLSNDELLVRPVVGAGHLLGPAYEKVDPLVGGEKYEGEKQMGRGMNCAVEGTGLPL